MMATILSMTGQNMTRGRKRQQSDKDTKYNPHLGKTGTPCLYFALYGACTQDGCRRDHVSAQKAKEWKARYHDDHPARDRKKSYDGNDTVDVKHPTRDREKSYNGNDTVDTKSEHDSVSLFAHRKNKTQRNTVDAKHPARDRKKSFDGIDTVDGKGEHDSVSLLAHHKNKTQKRNYQSPLSSTIDARDGSIHYLIGMPKRSNLNGTRVRVIKHTLLNDSHILVYPVDPISLEMGNCLTQRGVLPSQVTRNRPPGVEPSVSPASVNAHAQMCAQHPTPNAQRTTPSVQRAARSVPGTLCVQRAARSVPDTLCIDFALYGACAPNDCRHDHISAEKTKEWKEQHDSERKEWKRPPSNRHDDTDDDDSVRPPSNHGRGRHNRDDDTDEEDSDRESGNRWTKDKRKSKSYQRKLCFQYKTYKDDKIYKFEHVSGSEINMIGTGPTKRVRNASSAPKQSDTDTIGKGPTKRVRFASSAPKQQIKQEFESPQASTQPNPIGSTRYLVGMPTRSKLNGMKVKVIKHDDDDRYTQVWPLGTLSLKMGDMLMKHGVLPTQLSRAGPTQVETNSVGTPHVRRAHFLCHRGMRTIMDPVAPHTVVPSREHCLQGSVYKLGKPIIMFGYTGGPTQMVTHAGTLCIKSNTGCRGHMLLPTYINPAARRILINQAVMEDQGWCAKYGGKGVRIRATNSQENFLALERYDESYESYVDKQIKKHRYGSLDSKLDDLDTERVYPIPDVCIVTDFNITQAIHVSGYYNTQIPTEDELPLRDGLSPGLLMCPSLGGRRGAKSFKPQGNKLNKGMPKIRAQPDVQTLTPMVEHDDLVGWSESSEPEEKMEESQEAPTNPDNPDDPVLKENKPQVAVTSLPDPPNTDIILEDPLEDPVDWYKEPEVEVKQEEKLASHPSEPSKLEGKVERSPEAHTNTDSHSTDTDIPAPDEHAPSESKAHQIESAQRAARSEQRAASDAQRAASSTQHASASENASASTSTYNRKLVQTCASVSACAQACAQHAAPNAQAAPNTQRAALSVQSIDPVDTQEMVTAGQVPQPTKPVERPYTTKEKYEMGYGVNPETRLSVISDSVPDPQQERSMDQKILDILHSHDEVEETLSVTLRQRAQLPRSRSPITPTFSISCNTSAASVALQALFAGTGIIIQADQSSKLYTTARKAADKKKLAPEGGAADQDVTLRDTDDADDVPGTHVRNDPEAIIRDPQNPTASPKPDATMETAEHARKYSAILDTAHMHAILYIYAHIFTLSILIYIYISFHTRIFILRKKLSTSSSSSSATTPAVTPPDPDLACR